MQRPHPLIIAATLGAAGSLAASALAVATGCLWLTASAVFLAGIASLVPGFLDYRQTRRALIQARRQVTRSETAAPEQATHLPESFGQTIH